MTTKHTPGPWTYMDGKKSLLHIETAADAPIAGIHICSINKSKAADARLIASAPENTESNIYMTSVVEKCIKVIADFLPSPWMSEGDALNVIIGILDNAEIVEKLKASKSAIAKATNQKEEAI